MEENHLLNERRQKKLALQERKLTHTKTKKQKKIIFFFCTKRLVEGKHLTDNIFKTGLEFHKVRMGRRTMIEFTFQTLLVATVATVGQMDQS